MAVIRALAQAAGTPVASPDQAAAQVVAMKRVTGSPGYPLDEAAVRDIACRSYERSPGAAEGDLRQRAAIIASGDRRRKLASLRTPTLVIHGEDDPLMRPRGAGPPQPPFPARLVTYPGMGHDLPAALWPSVLDEICALAARGQG